MDCSNSNTANLTQIITTTNHCQPSPAHQLVQPQSHQQTHKHSLASLSSSSSSATATSSSSSSSSVAPPSSPHQQLEPLNPLQPHDSIVSQQGLACSHPLPLAAHLQISNRTEPTNSDPSSPQLVTTTFAINKNDINNPSHLPSSSSPQSPFSSSLLSPPSTSSSSSSSAPASPFSSSSSSSLASITHPNLPINSPSSSLPSPLDPPVNPVPLSQPNKIIPLPTSYSPPHYSVNTTSPHPPPSYLPTTPSIRRRSPTLHSNSTGFDKSNRLIMECPGYSPSFQPSLISNDHPAPSCNQILNEKSAPLGKPSHHPFLAHSPSKPQPGCISPTISAIGSSRRRSWVDYLLVLLVLVTVGTVVVLSTVNYYVGIYPSDVILPSELEAEPLRPSRVPKIIHQTWKTDQIPDRWIPVRESCVAAHESWEYMLWTDKSGRELIEREYPWFLPIYDGYRYPIQRADAVRYFILHHYGGVYMDLDIGCLRPMDSLLRFDLVLPQTVPVGISNDLMFSAKEHPFMDFIIHRLGQFDHDYHLNYATVMFSTGPMALSALLNMFRRSPSFGLTPGLPAFGPVRILPPKLYGKNLVAPQPSPGPYFTHYYGSSWHTDGAGLVLWLGKFGIFGLYGGILVVLLYGLRVAFKCCRPQTAASEGVLSSSWSTVSLPVKSRRSAGTLWKRRLMKVRRTDSRLADDLLLPGHLLGKVTSNSPKPSRSHRTHYQKDCMQCNSCTMAHGLLDSAHQLPLYESRPLHCLSCGRRPRKSNRSDSSPADDDWEEIDEDTALLSSTSTSNLTSNPTPVLLPSTPAFYRSPNPAPLALPSLRVELNQEVAPGLPSPLLNAIYRLAEMAGIVSENGQRSDIHSNSPTRPDDTTLLSGARPNSDRKVD